MMSFLPSLTMISSNVFLLLPSPGLFLIAFDKRLPALVVFWDLARLGLDPGLFVVSERGFSPGRTPVAFRLYALAASLCDNPANKRLVAGSARHDQGGDEFHPRIACNAAGSLCCFVERVKDAGYIVVSI